MFAKFELIFLILNSKTTIMGVINEIISKLRYNITVKIQQYYRLMICTFYSLFRRARSSSQTSTHYSI